MHITQARTADVETHMPQLCDLLIDTVESGASIGWIPPISRADADRYWQGRADAINEGACVLLIAWEDAAIVGSAQLGLEQRANGNHRAEVQKVMVHTRQRRQGIGQALMLALEDYAIKGGRTLLFLDTRQGDPSEGLYRKVGYIHAGTIPQYARSANGNLHATAFYYKILGE
ncbi:MAG: GNAT family N-acetyltransferase [Anaerolineae bacterium]|nr:GNAT family N-acetyltransferase [Anaerolineae bacterium]